MGSLIVVLIAVAAYCSEARCDTLPTTSIVKPKDAGFLTEANISHVTEKGIFSRNPGLHEPIKIEELKSPDGVANKRRARILGSLAFLAGMSVGGLASAASSTVKNLARIPQASLTLNLGSSKASPYFAAYYTPYSFVPYPFLYHVPFGPLPVANPSKPSQMSSQDEAMQQVISVFENGQPGDFADSNEEYVDQEKNSDDDKRDEDGAEQQPELRAEADRNAEEKVVIRGCEKAQRKHVYSFRESPKKREDPQVDADDPTRASDMTANKNQTVKDNTTKRPRPHFEPTHRQTHRPVHRPAPVTMPVQRPGSTPSPTPLTTLKPPDQTNTTNSTEYPYFPGYYEGYPQDISQVDLTTGSGAYHYQDHDINYNLPYERPANFYPDDIYLNHHANSYLPGSFPLDQINGYGYPSQYQSPVFTNGFKPVK